MVLVPQVKIAVPRVPSEFVPRPDLCADLDAGAAAAVALVCAPAGYGKTLLLADWARTSTATDIAWVGLDQGDNDPRRLWSAIGAAVTNCPSVPPSSRLQPPRAWRPATQPEFIARVRRRPGRFAAADPADPRRRAGTGRPAGAGRACAPSSGSSRRPFSSCWPAGLIRRCRCPGCGWPAGCGSCAPRSCPSPRRRRRRC